MKLKAFSPVHIRILALSLSSTLAGTVLTYVATDTAASIVGYGAAIVGNISLAGLAFWETE